MDPYFGCWIPGKVDDDPDFVMKLGVFYTCEVDSVSDYGENVIIIVLPCLSLALYTRETSSGLKIMSLCLVCIPSHFLYCICKENISPWGSSLRQDAVATQARTCVKVEYLHGWRKRPSQNFSCFMFNWRTQLANSYFSKLYIRSRLAEIDSDTYWM
jgi:hypothetical protein